MARTRPNLVSAIAILFCPIGLYYAWKGYELVTLPIPSLTGTPLEAIANMVAAAGAALVVTGVLLPVAGWGLWTLRSWGRMLSIVLSVLSIVVLIVAAFFLFGGLELPMGIGRISVPGWATGCLLYAALYGAIVYYLFRPEVQNLFDDGAGGTMPRLTCPSCRGPIESGWQRCPHCGYMLVEPRRSEPRSEPIVDRTSASSTQKIGDDTTVVGQLVVKSGPRRNTVYQLQARTKVGRDSRACQIVLEDDTVSGQHAEFLLNAGQYEVVDLASTNHVYVNGKRVARMLLLDGDVLKMGNTTLVYRKT